ncbi:DsbA family oxidoreductase [Acholeplasma granularum]|uniref:DsbA family oxidoreductase n=1 Tax=Acholeplasma granularum TaxID=264635 RepID=UPI0004709CE9|nr:DsbA family oxidoreductase [Acholeplasma granularum]
MKIEIWSDFSCPFCYIGKETFEEVLNEFPNKDKIEVVYKSYQLNPDAPINTNLDSYTIFSQLKGISLNQTKQIFMQTVERAKTIGLTYNYDDMKMTNTFKSHRLAKWARTFNKEGEISKLLFDAYFTKGKNLNDNDVLLNIVKSLQLNEEIALNVLESNLFEDEVNNEIDEARSIGVTGVPFFVLDRKYAVSGAQPKEVFKQALTQSFKEHQPFKTFGNNDDSCGPEGCDI